MYCAACGKLIPDDANYCSGCGKRAGAAGVRRRLFRPRAGRKIAGVCAGFAEYFDVDVTVVRLICLLAVVFTLPLAIVGYIVAWIIMPEEPGLNGQGATVSPPHGSTGQGQE